ncbi:MAG: restriction endonuclease subunit S [Caldisericaceae bacterium]
MTEKFSLPKGWRWVKLGEVCEIIMGQSPPGSTYNKESKGLPFYQGKADFGNVFLLPPSTWCTEPLKIAEPNDILISVRAPVGQANICSERCCIGRGLAAIRAKKDVNLWFVFYFLRFIEKEIATLGSGSTFPAISKFQIYNLKIPLPPLFEQERIVSKLQELMQQIDRARSACEKQLEAAKALPSAYLREVFESEEAKRWERKRLGEVCEILKGKKPELYDNKKSEAMIPYLTAEVIRFGSTPKWCLKSDKNSVVVDKDEIIIIADGSNSGEVFTGYTGVLASTMGKLKINKNVSKDYLYFFIKMNFKELNTPKRGSATPHLDKDIFYELSIPLPSLSEQQRIASYLKEKMAYIQNLQSAIQKQQSAINALPQAILRKAFRGEL